MVGGLGDEFDRTRRGPARVELACALAQEPELRLRRLQLAFDLGRVAASRAQRRKEPVEVLVGVAPLLLEPLVAHSPAPPEIRLGEALREKRRLRGAECARVDRGARLALDHAHALLRDPRDLLGALAHLARALA